MGQEPRGALEDGDLRPRAGGQVRELRRDIAAADEHDPAREALELQKIVARAHQHLAGNMERARVCAGGDEGMAGLQGAVANRDPVRRDEAGDAVESVRAELGIAPFLPSRDRIGERPLERDQVRPIDRQSPLDAMPDHARGRIGRLLAAHQHLLRVAAAKRAGSAERAMIDDRDGPPGGADPADGDLGGRAAADDDQVVWRLPGHGVLSSHSRRCARRSGSADRLHRRMSRTRNSRRSWASVWPRSRRSRRTRCRRRWAWFPSPHARSRGR